MIVGVLAPTVFVNGSNVVCQGAQVASHGIAPHASPVMVGHSGTVNAEGIPICRAGDTASCGHAASGSGNVLAG